VSTIEIVGASGVQKMLADYMTPKLPKRLQDATKAGADVFKPAVKAEARAVSKRLARSVSVRQAKKDRPATILTFRPKVAFFRHFVIGGTKDHGPRRAAALSFQGRSGFVVTKHVRGVRPNPIITRVANRLESQAYAAIDRSLDRSEAT
jgi:hypothetical protein